MCWLFVSIDQTCHTVTLTDDVMQNPMSLENNSIHSPKKKTMQYFKNLQPFTSKYPLKHQYLLETSYIKMIPTISSIQYYKNSSLKAIIY